LVADTHGPDRVTAQQQLKTIEVRATVVIEGAIVVSREQEAKSEYQTATDQFERGGSHGP
jgi:hypothetical protein